MTTYYLKDANGNQFPVQSTPIGPQPGATSICVTNATDALAEPGGAAIAGAVLPSGGLGLTGWLSAVWKALTGTLSVSWSGQSVGVSSLPSLPAGANAIGSVLVSNLPVTQAVSAAALPLPAGASTASNQTSVQSAPGVAQMVAVTIQGNASGIAVPVSLPSLPAGSNAIGSVSVSNFPSSQLVSDSQSAPFSGAVAMIVGATYAAGRTVEVDCTAAGNVVFMLSNGSTRTKAVVTGSQSFPYACTQIVPAGTTAAATYFNML